MRGLTVQEIEGGVVFSAKVVPGSSRTAVCGLLEGVLKIKVSAAPEKGKANKCLTEHLAERLGVRKSEVAILAGRTRAIKQVRVSGIRAADLLKRLDLSERGPGE